MMMEAVVRIRMASTMAGMARLNRIWLCNAISFASKFKLYKALATSTLLCGCETWTLFADWKKGSRLSKPSIRGNFSISPTWSTRPMTGYAARSTSLWVGRNFFWQLSRDRNMHGSGMSHATTASPKPSFRAPWRLSDAVAGRGNAGWTISKSGRACPCQNCSQGHPAKETGRGSLLNHPSCSPDDPTGQGTELNWTEFYFGTWVNVWYRWT